MYSDMSKRIIARSLLKRNSASDLASCVFPTPVGPRKMNEPTGRRGFLRPARERLIARASASTASRWPTTRARSQSSIRRSFSISSCATRVTGTPVHLETTSSTSARPTAIGAFASRSASARSWSARSRSETSLSCQVTASSKSLRARAFFIPSTACWISFSTSRRPR